jgi:Leucine-rich repeat (LRR) protein
MTSVQTSTSKPKLRWYYLTPNRLILGLLVLVGFLLQSEQLSWFAFSEHKNLALLIAVAACGVTLSILILWFVVALLLRKRFQYSLRSLLVLTVIVAILCSWFMVQRGQASRQKEAVEAIVTLMNDRYKIEYAYQRDSDLAPIAGATPHGPLWLRKTLGEDFFNNVTVANLSCRKIKEVDLAPLRVLKLLKFLSLAQTQIRDVGLQHITTLSQLQMLDLSGTQITDAGLEHLKGLTQLSFISLSFTKITDAGLKHLAGMKQLKNLLLYDTRITDAGLKYLAGLEQLQSIDLRVTQITDSGLKHLEVLKRLQYVNLAKTQVTDAGVKKLQKALPNLKIELNN